MARGMGLVGVAGVGHWGKPCESSNRLELLEVCMQYVEACMQQRCVASTKCKDIKPWSTARQSVLRYGRIAVLCHGATSGRPDL